MYSFIGYGRTNKHKTYKQTATNPISKRQHFVVLKRLFDITKPFSTINPENAKSVLLVIVLVSALIATYVVCNFAVHATAFSFHAIFLATLGINLAPVITPKVIDFTSYGLFQLVSLVMLSENFENISANSDKLVNIITGYYKSTDQYIDDNINYSRRRP